jgi:hypothetical protein
MGLHGDIYIYKLYNILIFKHVHNTPWEDFSMGYPFYLAAYHLKVVPRGHFSDTWPFKSLKVGISTGDVFEKNGSFSMAMRRPQGILPGSQTLWF